jgi:hypothetical protein
MTTINVNTYPNQPFTLADAVPLFIGEDSLIFENNFNIYKLNLRTGSLIYTNAINNVLGDVAKGAIIEKTITKGGNIAMTFLYCKNAETRGSRYLYARRFVLNSTDLSLVSYGNEIQFSNNTIDVAPFGLYPPLELSPNHLVYSHVEKSNFIVVDLWKKSIYTMSEYSPTGYAMVPFGIVRDRTNNQLALLAGKHYWISGSYSYVYAINPRDWSQIAASTSYDSGSGAMLQRMLYRDTTGTVRMILFGASGGYSYTQYTSKWNAIYVDNNSIANEFTVVAGSAYGTFDAGNRFPHVLGVTANNTLLLGVYGRAQGGVSSFGVSVMEVNDQLQNPTNMVQASFPISTSENSGQIGGWRNFFLLESDWNFYVYGGIVTYNNTPTLVIFQVTDYPDIVDPDPYGYYVVPQSGLKPTKLTLSVTPL